MRGLYTYGRLILAQVICLKFVEGLLNIIRANKQRVTAITNELLR